MTFDVGEDSSTNSGVDMEGMNVLVNKRYTTRYKFCLKVAILSLWGVLSDDWSGYVPVGRISPLSRFFFFAFSFFIFHCFC
jgi:hypothetical protein